MKKSATKWIRRAREYKMRLSRYSLFSLVLLVFSLLTSPGAFAQFQIPPGKYVLFEDHRLYYYCQGKGSPTVIIEGGIGDASVNWLPVQESLSSQMQVCIYDRGGYGMSDTGPGMRTTKQIVYELYRLLKTAEIAGPYIIVGQSFGGFIAQFFARTFPDETMGLVLVDSSHPEQLEYLSDLDLYSSKLKKPGNWKIQEYYRGHRGLAETVAYA